MWGFSHDGKSHSFAAIWRAPATRRPRRPHKLRGRLFSARPRLGLDTVDECGVGQRT